MVGAMPDSQAHLYVPRPPWRFTGRSVAPGVWRVDDPIPTPDFEGLSPRLAVALETRHRLALAQLSTHDLATGNRLYAAALRDIVRLEDEEIADVCCWAGNHAARTARDAYREGRQVWRRLAAWPWLEFASDAHPPSSWRQGDMPRKLTRSLETWATGMVGSQ